MAPAAGLQAEDLSNEPLLQQALQDAGGQKRPVLGGIPLYSKVGAGNAGIVYRGVHPTLGCEVAVKVMPCDDPASQRLPIMLAHANAALRVKAPHVAGLLHVGTEAGVLFFVNEYVAGVSAQSHLDAVRARLQPGLDEAAALDVCCAAAEGLSALHAANLLHMDIRPSSILIPAPQGGTPAFADARLADLGQAYNFFSARLLTGTAAETGTPGFMSPEQAAGSKELTTACDVFSLGATLHALLAGQTPFDGASLEDILANTMGGSPESLRAWRPDVSRATAKVIEICLRKQPAERFANGGSLQRALLIARAARGSSFDAQVAAVAQIEALVQPAVAPLAPTAAEAAPAPSPLTQTTRPALSAFSSPTVVATARETAQLEQELEATLIGTAPPQPAAPQPAQDTAAADEPTLVYAAPPAAPSSPATQAANPALAEWEDPTLQHEEAPTPPRRRRAVALAAALLLVLCGVGAWRLGWLDTWLQPQRRPIAPVALNTQPAEQDRKGQVEAAKEQEERDKRAADEARVKRAEERLSAEAFLKSIKDKEEEERRAAEAKAKAEQERLAIETALKAATEKKDEERRAAEAKAKAEQERVAAEARAKAAKEKEDEERRAAEAKAKAEQERVAAEARAKAAKEKEDEERRAAEAKAKAEQERIAAETKSGPPKAVQPQTTNLKPEPAALPKEAAVDLGGGVRMDFVLAPAGEFTMGTDPDVLAKLARQAGAGEKDYLDETPAHRAAVRAFYIAKTPVTVAQFRAFVKATGYKTTVERRGEAYTLGDHAWQLTKGASWQRPYFEQGDSHPVVFVSLRDCEAFAAWAAQQTGKPLRLPTEAEWEYAARGPDNNVYPWGDAWDNHRANHRDKRLKPLGPPDWKYSGSDDGFAFTAPAGAYRNQSWCGALDLAGNVLQWCADAYEPYPRTENAPQIVADDAAVPPNTPRVLRGSSYLSAPFNCRSAVRQSSAPRSASCEYGMRLAFTP